MKEIEIKALMAAILYPRPHRHSRLKLTMADRAKIAAQRAEVVYNQVLCQVVERQQKVNAAVAAFQEKEASGQ